jgi:hypothetical protein
MIVGEDAIFDHLEHYGVKGMRWGVRRKNKISSSERKRVDKIEKKFKEKGLHSLTNKEIGDYTKRLEMENKVKKLNEKPKRKNPITEGHNFVRAALAIGATANGVYAFSRSPAGQRLARSMAEAAARKRAGRSGPGHATAEIVRLALPAGR